MEWTGWLDGGLFFGALGVALLLQPWRLWPHQPPAWPALAWAALLPVMWSVDLLTGRPLAQPISGACVLLLMLGWPAAVLVIALVAAVMALGGATMGIGGLVPAEALHRAVWLGVVPATFGLLLGAAIRHGLPRHVFVYILGRGFFGTTLAAAAAGALAVALFGVSGPTAAEDIVLARVLVASGDGFITGMLVAIFVAFRPGWLATYTDPLYLPRDGSV
jgi:uncharacterized membrane protein